MAFFDAEKTLLRDVNRVVCKMKVAIKHSVLSVKNAGLRGGV